MVFGPHNQCSCQLNLAMLRKLSFRLNKTMYIQLHRYTLNISKYTANIQIYRQFMRDWHRIEGPWGMLLFSLLQCSDLIGLSLHSPRANHSCRENIVLQKLCTFTETYYVASREESYKCIHYLFQLKYIFQGLLAADTGNLVSLRRLTYLESTDLR